jgi:cytochrome c oxidase cbb3-type subunit III
MSDSSTEQKVAHTTGDGIEEYDNRLPNWWLATFYGAILFGVGYWFYFQVFQVGETTQAAWRREVAEIAAKSGQNIVVTSQQLVDLSKDPAVLAEGKQIFTTTCVACHAASGGGIVGPNLTDEYWLHGGAPDQIFTTVRDGVAIKGMPAWGPQLGITRVQAVTAYVLTLRNTNVPGGKPPQGDKFAQAN